MNRIKIRNIQITKSEYLSQIEAAEYFLSIGYYNMAISCLKIAIHYNDSDYAKSLLDRFKKSNRDINQRGLPCLK